MTIGKADTREGTSADSGQGSDQTEILFWDDSCLQNQGNQEFIHVLDRVEEIRGVLLACKRWHYCPHHAAAQGNSWTEAFLSVCYPNIQGFTNKDTWSACFSPFQIHGMVDKHQVPDPALQINLVTGHD